MSPLVFSRRAFLGKSANGLGHVALSSMLMTSLAKLARGGQPDEANMDAFRTIAPKAKRVIYLFQSGGPSHVDLFDGKDILTKLHGTDLPNSVRGDQRVTGMTAGQSKFPVVQPILPGKLCGPSDVWISDLLPYTQKIADEICVVRSMHTEAINHDPAITLINTGSMQLGNASAGAWVSYGLGTRKREPSRLHGAASRRAPARSRANRSSRGCGAAASCPPSIRASSSAPAAIPCSIWTIRPASAANSAARSSTISPSSTTTSPRKSAIPKPSPASMPTKWRSACRPPCPSSPTYRDESAATFELYGPESRKPGTYAANCLLARRLAERGVRFIQLFHRGWDQHIAITKQLPNQCRDTDQPSAALILDLKQRGLLEDTLVIWGGEFGRTVYSQGALGSPVAGRDHHGRCFSIWMAGGGVKGGCATARPTTSARTSPRTLSTSATSTPPCSTSSASTTTASPTPTAASHKSSSAWNPPS